MEITKITFLTTMVNGLFTVVMELFGPFKGNKLCSLHHCLCTNVLLNICISFFLFLLPLLPHPHSNLCIHCEMNIIFKLMHPSS